MNNILLRCLLAGSILICIFAWLSGVTLGLGGGGGFDARFNEISLLFSVVLAIMLFWPRGYKHTVVSVAILVIALLFNWLIIDYSRHSVWMTTYLDGITPESCISGEPYVPWGYRVSERASRFQTDQDLQVSCLQNLIVERGYDYKLCSELSGKELQDECYAYAGRFKCDVSICDNVVEQKLRDTCYVMQTSQCRFREPSKIVCSKIVDIKSRDDCYDFTSIFVDGPRKEALCSLILDPANRNYCDQ